MTVVKTGYMHRYSQLVISTLCRMVELCVCGKPRHAGITQCERCEKKHTLFDMTWQPVHAWPQLKKDEIVCMPSVSLRVQCKVLPTQKGSRPCEQHVHKAGSRAKILAACTMKKQKKVPVDLEASYQ